MLLPLRRILRAARQSRIWQLFVRSPTPSRSLTQPQLPPQPHRWRVLSRAGRCLCQCLHLAATPDPMQYWPPQWLDCLEAVSSMGCGENRLQASTTFDTQNCRRFGRAKCDFAGLHDRRGGTSGWLTTSSQLEQRWQRQPPRYQAHRQQSYGRMGVQHEDDAKQSRTRNLRSSATPQQQGISESPRKDHQRSAWSSSS